MRRIEANWPTPVTVTAFTAIRPQPDEDTLLRCLPAGSTLARLEQVHGTHVVAAQDAVLAQNADAVYTRQPLMACAVRTADCLPVLICNRKGNEVAAIHAGWRGLAAGVIESTLDTLQSGREDLMVWLGPAISQQHFEVGPEVRDTFLQMAPNQERAAIERAFKPAAPGKYQADLYALAAGRLQRAGINAVYGGELCSFSDSQRLYSWRRDRDEGRLISVIAFVDSKQPLDNPA
jgi:YfiH family protein